MPSQSLVIVLTIITLIGTLVAGIFGSAQMFPEMLRWSLASRIALCSATLALIIFVIFLIYNYSKWIDYVKEISEKLATFLFLLIFHPFARLFYLILILIAIIIISNFNYSVIALSGLAFVVLLLSFKQFPLQEYKKDNQKEVIFDDHFLNNKGWFLNYWGTTNPSKTNRIENSNIIFEAKEEELLDKKKEFGAYIDLKNGIEEGSTYEISCKVKSENYTTMGFQIWAHDTVGGSPAVSTKEPVYFYLPSQSYQTIKMKYKANYTNAIRIHLHNKGGEGKILVDRLTVSKVY